MLMAISSLVTSSPTFTEPSLSKAIWETLRKKKKKKEKAKVKLVGEKINYIGPVNIKKQDSIEMEASWLTNWSICVLPQQWNQCW